MKMVFAILAIIAVALMAMGCSGQPMPGVGSYGTVPPATNAAPTPEAPTTTTPSDPGTVGENPVWLTQLIEKLKSEPVANPPASIIEYKYRGQTVYFRPAPCCDRMSILYDYSGRIIGHPDGGIDGQGDGIALDFFEVRTGGKTVWEDDRDLAVNDSREAVASTPMLLPTPTPTPTPATSVVASDDFSDARISMREGAGYSAWSESTLSTRLCCVTRVFLAVANQEARTECSAITISPEDQELLWRTLYDNDAFTLRDDSEVLSVVSDESFYDIIAEHNGQRNEFSVYGPGFLADRLEGRYLAIVDAIRDLANLRLPPPSLEACTDYQVANQTPTPTPTVSTTSSEAFAGPAKEYPRQPGNPWLRTPSGTRFPRPTE